jgi:hypothetical protein
MRAIKADMISKHFKDIPNQLRAMARLWPPSNGVHGRRFLEAALFEKGLAAPVSDALDKALDAFVADKPAPIMTDAPKRSISHLVFF